MAFPNIIFPNIPPYQTPSSLPANDQFMHAVGGLVMEWATCENLMFAMFRCLIGNKFNDMPHLIWFSMQNMKARVDMVRHGARVAELSEPLLVEIDRVAGLFEGVTKTRNWYCHAYYGGNPETNELTHIEGVRIVSDETIFRHELKKADRATLNELADAVRRCRLLAQQMWPVLLQLRKEIGAEHVVLPDWLKSQTF